MAKKMKIYTVVLDGIDKTGKSMIADYLYYLGKKKYICCARGIMSMITYSKLFQRNYKYNLLPQKNVLNVLLDANYDDWYVRCKHTDEPMVFDYNIHKNEFYNTFELLRKNKCPVAYYNTSVTTPYNIAIDILKKLETLNE